MKAYTHKATPIDGNIAENASHFSVYPGMKEGMKENFCADGCVQ
jgi:hypothetical protein